MKKVVIIALAVLCFILIGCNKDDNQISGTSWLSTYSSECWWENDHLDGDFSEVLSFDKAEVQSKTLKNGYTYRNNWTRSYTIEDNAVNIDGKSTYYLYGNTLTNGIYTFYKQ